MGTGISRLFLPLRICGSRIRFRKDGVNGTGAQKKLAAFRLFAKKKTAGCAGRRRKERRRAMGSVRVVMGIAGRQAANFSDGYHEGDRTENEEPWAALGGKDATKTQYRTHRHRHQNRVNKIHSGIVWITASDSSAEFTRNFRSRGAGSPRSPHCAPRPDNAAADAAADRPARGHRAR